MRKSRNGFAAFALAAGIAGCSGQLVGENVGGEQQWLCDIEDGAVVCTVAMPAAAGEIGAYACMAGEERVTCPPAASFEGIAGLDELLVAYDFGDDFYALPWACLLTGEHQRHCARDVDRATAALRSEPTPSGDPDGDGGGDYTPAPDGGDELGGGDPELPGDCLPASWEAYFCAHATHEYRSHGVDITFPCDVFDASADFTGLALASAGVPTTAGAPSCHEGEWAMREGAWRDAVLVGCMDLNTEILVLCQQAANYAPTAGVCNATGTW